jgi:hypothetical protein
MAIESFSMEMEKQEILNEQIDDAMGATEEECTDEDADRLIDQLTTNAGGGGGGGLGLNNMIQQQEEPKKETQLDDLENRLADLKK